MSRPHATKPRTWVGRETRPVSFTCRKCDQLLFQGLLQSDPVVVTKSCISVDSLSVNMGTFVNIVFPHATVKLRLHYITQESSGRAPGLHISPNLQCVLGHWASLGHAVDTIFDWFKVMGHERACSCIRIQFWISTVFSKYSWSSLVRWSDATLLGGL